MQNLAFNCLAKMDGKMAIKRLFQNLALAITSILIVFLCLEIFLNLKIGQTLTKKAQDRHIYQTAEWVAEDEKINKHRTLTYCQTKFGFCDEVRTEQKPCYQ